LILETNRLILREMQQSDYPALCAMLQDDEVMYAYEGAFSDEEAQAWLDMQLRRYAEDGFGLWAVILKEGGQEGVKMGDQLIGQCGITWQSLADRQVMEVGYIFNKDYWHQGYATEAARACRDYAFEKLAADEVFSIIRDTNMASIGVARRNGMSVSDSSVKHYRGVDMPHIHFSIDRQSWSMYRKINRFLDSQGRLTAYPAKYKLRVFSQFYLASKFDPGLVYSEGEINSVLQAWHSFDDWAMLRRDLYDSRFLGREPDCSQYWLEANQPTLAGFRLEV